MTSPNSTQHTLLTEFANRSLEDLYARRNVVDQLIRSLEEYERYAKRSSRMPLPAAR